MGFQSSVADNTNNVDSNSKAKYDKNGDDELTVSVPCDHSSNRPNAATTHSSYNSWLNDHPSALGCFKGMMRSAKGKRIVVFLDYDGTLSPIVNDPDRAYMSDPVTINLYFVRVLPIVDPNDDVKLCAQMRSAVREVARCFPTAIISGRSRKKVQEFVKLDEVYYAGSHGMDIRGPSGQLKSYDNKYQNRALDKKGNEFTDFQPAHEYLPAVKEMLKALEKKTSEIEGVVIEDNTFCISVHYRRVAEEDYGKLQEKVQYVLTKYPGFHLTRGKKVIEIRPPINWNKGDALKYFLDTLGFANSGNVFPIYVGDDRTDEDAFKVSDPI
ncbi:trehalose-phosphatase [Sarracenia purpurea var. burkii]